MFFESHVNVRLLVEGVESRVVHLAMGVRLRTPEGAWTRTTMAILDPGSPYSIIPHSVWSAAAHRLLVKDALPLAGVGGGRALAPLGHVTLTLDDGTSVSPPFAVRALLMPDDSEPFLPGFEDLLTRFALYCDHARGIAYLDVPA